MALLGALLVNLVGGLMGFFVHFVTKKIAFGLAVVATLATIVGVVLAAMRTLITALAVTLSDPLFQMGLAMGYPPNASACIAAIATSWAACTLYSWQRDALDLFAKVS